MELLSLLDQKKSHKKQTKLLNLATFSACQVILDSAEEKADVEMLTKIIGGVDLIAAGGKYHQNCKAQYTARRNMKYTSRITKLKPETLSAK